MSAICRHVAAMVLTAAAACTASVLAETPPVPDPWGPGASVEPWPLIEQLQRWGIGSQPEPDWRAAVAHDEPLVRAAAAAALGRTARPEQRALIQQLLADRVRLVRRTAQWAALQQVDTIPVELADEALSDLRAGDYDRPESNPGVVTLLERWVPPAIVFGTPAHRRAWLRERRGGLLSPLKRTAALGGPSSFTGGWVAVARSEWDGDEIVELTARVVASLPAGITLDRFVVPADPYRAPIDRRTTARSSEPALPTVTVRVVGGDGTGRLQLPRDGERLVRLAFDLEEMPPDVYTFRFGNPLFLRVRRGRAMEIRAAAAAGEVLTSAEALERVARLRVLAAAPALRRRFAESVQAYGFGFNAYRDALVLARMPDRATAELVLAALVASPTFLDPWTSERPDLGALFRNGFGGAAREILLPLLADWRRARELGWGDALVSVLGDRDWSGVPPLDAARFEILAAVPDSQAASGGPLQYQERNLLQAVQTAAAADHPREAAASLARVSRAGEMKGLLSMMTVGLSAAATERLLEEARAALANGGSAKEEARAALVEEAAALGVPLPADSQRR